MAFGSRFTSSMIPRGLSPEDEDFLRRQMFSQMGNALMANAFQGGDWRGLGSAIEPMNAMPGEAMKLMRFREEQAQEERQRRIAELAMQHAISGEGRAVAAEEREVDKHRLALDDRQREEVERESNAWNTSDDLIGGAAVLARLIPLAEQQLAAKGTSLGPATAELAGMIEALRSSSTAGHTPESVANWYSNFSAKLAEAEKGERTFSEQQRVQRRLEADLDLRKNSADARQWKTVKGDGFVLGFNPSTGETSGTIMLPGGQSGEIPLNVQREAIRQATAEIAPPGRSVAQWPEGTGEKITKRAAELIPGLMGLAGQKPPAQSTEDIMNGPLGAFLSSLKPVNP